MGAIVFALIVFIGVQGAAGEAGHAVNYKTNPHQVTKGYDHVNP